jgi:sulfatase maturation enzyme AslB (radical SAM superfamily)
MPLNPKRPTPPPSSARGPGLAQARAAERAQARLAEHAQAAIAQVLTQSQTLAASQRLEEAERLLAGHPDHLECVFRRGAVLLTLERWAEAESCFRRVLAAAPNHPDSAMGLAGALVEQGRPMEALPLLNAAKRANPQSGRIRYFRGIALEELGRGAEGLEEVATARSLLIGQVERRDLMPSEVFVQVSRRCNLRCAMCGHEVWQSNSGFIEEPIFTRVLDQCRENGIKKVNILSGQGEPMLHPRIFEMLERAVGDGFDVHIVTNGTPLTPERARRLGQLGLGSIQFSFAGWDKESYESVYIGSKFERTLENLRNLQEAVRGTRTDFFVKAVVADRNWAEVSRKTRDFLTGQGIEKVFTVAANNFGGTVKCGDFNQRHGVWTLKNLDHQRRMPCRIFLSAVGVYCDGTVTACGCYDSNAQLRIGHIMEQSLAEIRHGEPFQRLLEAFRSGDLTGVPMCGACDDPFG